MTVTRERWVVVCAEGFRTKSFATREGAANLLASIERAGICAHTHHIEVERTSTSVVE